MTSRTILSWCLAFWVFALSPSNQSASGQSARPEEVKFPSGKLVLHGFLYKPPGNGPFPAILYNHGSEKDPGPKPPLGAFFSSRGYVFFVPHRRGHGRSPHDSYIESLYAQGAAGRIALHETHLEDQLAALAYLKHLKPYSFITTTIGAGLFRKG
jgi:dipeptidyl aminopeptidase/acylaminoacyl peptidase